MTFVPTEYYGVEGPQLFARGISCLAKLKNGNPVDGSALKPSRKTCTWTSFRSCALLAFAYSLEMREPDDFLTITYDNTKEVLYEGLQNMGDDDCYIYLLGKVDAFTSYEYAPETDVYAYPELKLTSIGEGKFRTT